MKHPTIQKALTRLVLDRTFWATLALRRDYTPDATMGTFETDGKNIRYSQGFLDMLTVGETEGVIAHELYHIVAQHHLRREKRDPKLWNIACDFAINQHLLKDGFKLPEGALHDPRFKDMSAEQIYASFPPPPPEGSKSVGPVDIGNGEKADAPTWGIVKDGQPGTEFQCTAELVTAVKAGKMAGDVPGYMEELSQLFVRRKTNWRDILRRFAESGVQKRRSFSRPNRRYMSQDIYLPGRVKHGLSKINLIVDVSGSINRKMFEMFIGELEYIREDIQPEEVRVLTIDKRIVGDQIFLNGDPLDVKLKGRGGTSLDKAFAAIEDLAPTIVFTDGHFRDPSESPQNDVLWVIPDGGNKNRSFGEVVEIVE